MSLTVPTHVSAVVVSYHTGSRLRECLHALAGDPDISQIVLVDQGNPTDMQAWLAGFAQRTPKLLYKKRDRNPGFGAGVNYGVQFAQGTHLLVINPDTNPKRGAVAALLSASEDRGSATITGGRIFGLDGAEARGGRRRQLTLWRAISSLLGGRGISLHRNPPPPVPTNVAAISGAFFLISRDDFDKLGGFDEAYFLHFEDIDLCARLIKAGGTVIYAPHAGALHYGATSDVSSAVIARHKARSLNRYLRLHSASSIERFLAVLLAPVIALAFRLRGR